MDQESWIAEVKENAEFRGEVRQFIKQAPETMRNAAMSAVVAHNDDKEAHPKQRLAFVLSIVALAASVLGPAVWDRVKNAVERSTPSAQAAELHR